MPTAFGTLAGLLNIEANTNLLNQEAQDYKLLGQERAVRLQRLAQDQQDDQFRRQLLMDMAVGKQGTQYRGEQPVEGDPLIAKMTEQADREAQSARQLRQVADAMSSSGHFSIDAQKKAQAEADAADRTAVATARELRQEQSNLMKHIGSIAGSAVDEASFQRAYQQIAQMNPSLVRGVDRNEQSGIPTFGPNSQQIMKQLAAQGMDSGQQLDRKIKLDDEARKQADEARKAADDKARMDEVSAHTALYRAQAAAVDRKNKEDKKSDVAKTAEKEPTREMVQDTKYAVEAFVSEKYPGMKKDNTMNAFAVDVASRANTLRAEAEARGEKLSIEDARRKAMESLLPRLHTTETVSHWYKSDEPGVVSYRHTIAPPAAPKKEATPDQPKTADEYLRSIGVQ